MPDIIDAGSVMVSFQGEDGSITQVPVSHLLNELFATIFKLEERIAKLEDKKEVKSSPIITLD